MRHLYLIEHQTNYTPNWVRNVSSVCSRMHEILELKFQVESASVAKFTLFPIYGFMSNLMLFKLFFLRCVMIDNSHGNAWYNKIYLTMWMCRIYLSWMFHFLTSPWVHTIWIRNFVALLIKDSMSNQTGCISWENYWKGCSDKIVQFKALWYSLCSNSLE